MLSTVGRRATRAGGWLVAAAFASSMSCGGGSDPPTAPKPSLDATKSTLVVAAGPYVSGQAYSATFTARDQNNSLFVVSGAITFSLTGGSSGGSFSAVTSPATGTYTTTFTATTAGTAATVVVRVDGVALNLTSPPTIAVGPGPASFATSTVTVSAPSIPNGSAATLTLTARDANGNALTAGGLAVVFTKGAGTSDGPLSATTDNGNGSYTATFAATTAGTARTIGATIGGAAVTSALPTITVLPVASLALSAVAVSAATTASGSSVTLTLTTRDALGTAITVGGLTAVFTKGGGTSDGTISATTDVGNGTYTATFTATTAGSARSIAATIGGGAITSVAPTVTVTPGPLSLSQSAVTVSASTVAYPATSTLSLTARDAAGNQLASGGLAVVFNKGAGTSDGTISATIDNGNGTYTATFAATTPGSARAIGATIGGSAVTSAAPTITVTPGPASLSQSAVTVSVSTVAYPATSTLTFTARDAGGNAHTSGGLVVVFTKGGGTSDGAISATTDNNNGTYAATFTSSTAGTARSIGATIGGLPVTSAAPTITVTPGPASLAQSTVTVSTPSLVSGAVGTLTLTTRDGAGNARTTGGLVVVFTKGTGTSDGTISATADNGNGTYTATFASSTAGTARSIGATIGGLAVTSVAPTIIVTPGSLSLSQSAVTVSASTVAFPGTSTLTLTARDAAGNQLASGGLAVVFTKGPGTSDGTISATTDNGNGTYTATFTSSTAGTARSIGVTIGGLAVTSVAPTITVTPGPASLSQSTVTVSTSTVVYPATSTLTLTARDAGGNQLASGGLAVVFTRGAGTSDGTISATTDNANGTYTATFTATTAGSARAIGATIGGSAVTSADPTITVTPGSVSLSQSLVTVSLATTTLGNLVTLTLTARDAGGNALIAGGLVVVFTKGTGTSDGTISATTDAGNGTYTATFTPSVPGTARTIGATIGGSAVTSALPTLTVSAGPVSLSLSTVTVSASTVAYPGVVTLTLTARNASGVQMPTGGFVVVFTKGTGTSDGAISATTDNNNGTYTATFTSNSTGTARSIGATIDGPAVTSALPTVTVTPGPAAVAQSVVSVASATVASGAAPVTVTLTAKDAGGNALTSGGLTVLFTKGAGTSDGTFSATTDVANGTYTATFTGTTAGTARAIGATIGGIAVTTVLPTITVTPGPISTVTSTVSTSLASVVVGTTATLRLTAFDAAGNRIATGGSTVLFGLGAGTSAGTFSAVTDVADGTYTATFTATTVGTARTVTATIGGVAVTSALPTITVTPPIMGLGSDSVTINVQVATMAAPQLVSVASIFGGSIGGLATTITSLPLAGAPPECASINWMGTPTFDMLGVANPVSLMTLQADATLLALGTCKREVLVTSTTSGVVTRRLVVMLNVGRGAVASGVVNIVMMGDANSTALQDIVPIPVLKFDNGGRGIISGLAATVTATTGFNDCPSSGDPLTCTPWLHNADLTFSSPTMPSTLSIRSSIRAFGGDATIHVTAVGMTPSDFHIQVNFNIEAELVTNPRNVVLRGIAGGPAVLDSVMAFNQNFHNQGLSNYRINTDSAGPPPWLTVAIVQPVGDSGKIRLTANAAGHDPGELLKYRLALRADYAHTGCSSCPLPKLFTLPIEFTVEGGLSASLANATLYAPAGTTAATQDILVNHNGPGELSTLQLSVAGGAPWLTAAYVAGVTTTPATLRLTANPTGLAKATYSTTVTITSGVGPTLQTRAIPVKFTVF